MRLIFYVSSFFLIGFGLSLAFYLGFNFLIWSLMPSSRAEISEGLYLSSLVGSGNKNLAVLGLRETKQVKGLSKRNYFLSVPSINIENARIESNVNSKKEEVYFPILKQSVAHYEGTALPGEKGNVFLYGHSTLPAFYNPKDYLTIFSNLTKLKIGEEIIISDSSKNFRYVVFEKRVVDPSQLEFLKPHPFDTVTLMTCVPPGMTTKRLLVIGRLLN